MQYSGSVNTTIVGNPAAIIPVVNGIDALWAINVAGTVADQPRSFPTVPSTIDTNRLMYPGLGRSYIVHSGYIETPTHRQIQFQTQDIPSIQLTIRRGLSPDVLARWQLVSAGV
jgi:hypothetical protein